MAMTGTTARPVILVTGASSGIGSATVRVLADEFEVVAMVRDVAAANIANTGGSTIVRPVVADLRDHVSLDRSAAEVIDILGGRPLAALVHCAGIAVYGPLEFVPMSRVREQLEVNLLGPLRLTQLLLPALGSTLGTSRPGRIVFISSLSGSLADPFLGPYAASKHGLEAIAASLRREVAAAGIKVVVIAPGAVSTPIWEKAAADDISAYVGTPYGTALVRFRQLMFNEARNGCTAETVAKVVRTSLMRGRPRRRYTVMARPHVAYRLLPHLPAVVYDWLCRWSLRPEKTDKQTPSNGQP